MSKVIDLIDSDDEAPSVLIPEKRLKFEVTTEPKSTANTSTITTGQHNKIQANGINSSKATTPPPLPESTTITSSTATVATKSTFTSPTSTTGTNSTSTSPSSSNANKPVRHRSRKTPHQTIRFSPDMQFETISLDDEEQTPAPQTTEDVAPIVALPLLPSKPVSKGRPPKNPRKQPTITSRDTLIKAVSDRFIERPDTATLIRNIAADRVRVNYLMNAFSLPEINFAQSSHIEMLRFQLRDRLKQRRIRILTEELEQQVRTRQVLQLQQEKEEQEQRIQQQMGSMFSKLQ